MIKIYKIAVLTTDCEVVCIEHAWCMHINTAETTNTETHIKICMRMQKLMPRLGKQYRSSWGKKVKGTQQQSVACVKGTCLPRFKLKITRLVLGTDDKNIVPSKQFVIKSINDLIYILYTVSITHAFFICSFPCFSLTSRKCLWCNRQNDRSSVSYITGQR